MQVYQKVAIFLALLCFSTIGFAQILEPLPESEVTKRPAPCHSAKRQWMDTSTVYYNNGNLQRWSEVICCEYEGFKSCSQYGVTKTWFPNGQKKELYTVYDTDYIGSVSYEWYRSRSKFQQLKYKSKYLKLDTFKYTERDSIEKEDYLVWKNYNRANRVAYSKSGKLLFKQKWYGKNWHKVKEQNWHKETTKRKSCGWRDVRYNRDKEERQKIGKWKYYDFQGKWWKTEFYANDGTIEWTKEKD